MGWLNLYEHQRKALSQMHDGCILCGGVGTGKSITALAYYYQINGGSLESDDYLPMDYPCDLYIITTARKRDTLEWESEMKKFLLCKDSSLVDLYSHKVVVDSWNNIKKYTDVRDAFFIFDEQRVVGWGAWSKAFVKITKANRWILLSATPGDNWLDYIPVFVANGFYKNPTAFKQEHVIMTYYSKYPKVDRYVNQKKLRKIRDYILVEMPMARETVQHHEDIFCEYDFQLYRRIMRERWDPWEKKPIENISSLCYLLRRCANDVQIRVPTVTLELLQKHPKAIIFYNFDYELGALVKGMQEIGIPYAMWNGHRHDPVPTGSTWAYLVQYTAGAEGWNCITTDTIIFLSQNYSYKTMTQAAGRIDRLNTPYKDLYYFHLSSKAPIDLAIRRALKEKRNFNESRFIKQ